MSSFKDIPPVIAMPMQVKFKSETHIENMLFGIVPNDYDMDSIHVDYADDDKIFFYLTLSDYYGVLAGRLVLAEEWEVIR